ncbi:AAA family ATPase [Candidatus Bathyarchaeota archaeon]|jgi:CO dehydrogenase maturation factor|nr:AAA family ATPase [Candidatus Bathyarchaeota archaeon]
MKLAIAGKGGVGKTFTSATLSRLLAKEGYSVLAVDADPNFNLAYALGIDREKADRIRPLTENNELIREKTGVSAEEAYSPVFNMTPTVSDIVDRFGVDAPEGVKLLVMGTVKGGGTGCMCGANALLRVLIQHMLIQRGEILIMDMVAGLEHLGRGTARRMDAMLVVVEPRMKSMDTIRRILRLAEEIEIKEIMAIGNKISNEREEKFIREHMKKFGIPIVAMIPYDEKVGEADMLGIPAVDYDPDTPAIRSVRNLMDTLIERFNP